MRNTVWRITLIGVKWFKKGKMITIIKAYWWWRKAIKLHGKGNVKILFATRVSKNLDWQYWDFSEKGGINGQ